MDKTIDFDDFYIESPDGRKVLIHALNAYVPNFRDDGVLAHKRRDEKWYGQLVDAAEELGECKAFVDSKFNPKAFLETLKTKGYKVYWKEEKQPIFGLEGSVDGKGTIIHKTVIVGYKEDE